MPAAIAIPIITAGAGAAAGIYGANKQAGALRTAATLQTQSANRAGELEAQAAQRALDFAQQQEATRRAEFEKTQALNLDQYNQREGRLTPYRTLGASAANSLMQGLNNGDGRTLLPPPTVVRRRTLG